MSRQPDCWYDRVLRQDRRFYHPGRIDSLELLWPPFRRQVEMVLARLAACGHPAMVWETYRSEIRQQRLFKMGRTMLKHGVHQYGLAADIVWDLGGGEPSWRGPYGLLGGLAYEYQLTWGGDWDSDPGTHNKFNDLPHIQAVSLSEQPALFSGSWFPMEEKQ